MPRARVTTPADGERRHRPGRGLTAGARAPAVWAWILSLALTGVASGTGSAPPASRHDHRAEEPYLRPTLSIGARYDDNVFATSNRARSDWIRLVSPGVEIEFARPHQHLRFDVGAEVARFDTFDDEDYTDHWASLDGQFDLSDRSQLFARLGVSYEHEGRDAPDARNAAPEPTTYRIVDANAGVKTLFGDDQLQFGVTYEKLDFDDVASRRGRSRRGRLVNSDRDRTLIGLGMRVSRALDARRRWFVQALYDHRDYDRSTDRDGVRRDSWGYRLAGGIEMDLGTDGGFEGYVGILHQDYAERRFSSVDRLDFGARWNRSLDAATEVALSLQRTLQETTERGSPGYLDTQFTGRLERHLTARLMPYLEASYTLSEYLERGDDDRLTTLGGGLRFALTPNTDLTAGLNHVRRDSDRAVGDDSRDYERLTLYLTLTSRLYPSN